MAILVRDNDALEINPLPGYDRDLTENGSDWLWTVTAIYIVSFLLIYAHSFVAKSGEKIFHYLYSIALLVGSIAYFAMASNLGWEGSDQANEEDKGDPRQLFWAKYVYWVVAFPTVSIALGLMSNVSWATMIYWVGLCWTWLDTNTSLPTYARVIAYLLSAYTASNYRWGFYAFGTVAWLALAASVYMDGMKGAKRIEITSKHFTLLMGWTQLLWFLYVLAFGLTDGGNYLGVTPMFIWFGILDVFMVPVLAFATVFFARSWDFGKLNLHFTQYGRVRQGGTFPEKQAAPAPIGEQAA
ncbi:hypothetical protein MKZ38_004535 [Zalerion maritima]|uniref:Uncharacterized protein n=1 Tax=Zalerion maritima TaxID=339359 RepID=A0AAD5RLI6_9PEZI|nr:hypothetical protein MKZ38_004535 [Zalerion maritima]